MPINDTGLCIVCGSDMLYYNEYNGGYGSRDGKDLCPWCRDEASDQTYPTTHAGYMEENQNRPCPHCNEQLPVPENFMESSQSEESFPCDFCDKRIKWEYEWQRDYDVNANFDDLVIWLEAVE